MNNKKKEKKSITKKDIEEIKRLSQKADETKGFELGFAKEFNEEDGFELVVLKDAQNPNRAHRLYYTIESILRTNLPQGEKNAAIRKIVREEKTTFLNRGKRIDSTGRRGSDSRQAYLDSHLEKALGIVVRWVKEGANTFDLYMSFKELNDKFDSKKAN